MTCKWARKSLLGGKQDACLNPNVHSTRCDPDECPFARNIQRANELVRECREDLFEGIE